MFDIQEQWLLGCSYMRVVVSCCEKALLLLKSALRPSIPAAAPQHQSNAGARKLQ